MKLDFKLLKEPSKNNINQLKTILNEHVSFGSATETYINDLTKSHQVYVATHNEKIVGTVTLYFHSSQTEVKHVVTLPEYKNKGIASKLLKLALSEYNLKKPLTALGWTKPTGWEAERLFLKHGFIMTEEDTTFWESECKSIDFCPHFTDQCNCSCKLVKRSINS